MWFENFEYNKFRVIHVDKCFQFPGVVFDVEPGCQVNSDGDDDDDEEFEDVKSTKARPLFLCKQKGKRRVSLRCAQRSDKYLQ